MAATTRSLKVCIRAGCFFVLLWWCAFFFMKLVRDYLNYDHRAATAFACPCLNTHPLKGNLLPRQWREVITDRLCGQCFSDGGQYTFFWSSGKKAIMPDVGVTLHENMLATQIEEVLPLQGDDLPCIVIGIVPPRESDFFRCHVQYPVIGNGRTVCVSSQVADHLFRPSIRLLGEDHPGFVLQTGGHASNDFPVCQQLPCRCDKPTPESITEYINFEQVLASLSRMLPYAVFHECTCRLDHMQMGVVTELLAPGMKNSRGPDILSTMEIQQIPSAFI